MLRPEKQLWKWPTVKSGFKFLFAKSGLLHEFRADFLSYFEPDFHPWDSDNRHLLQHWQAQHGTKAA